MEAVYLDRCHCTIPYQLCLYTLNGDLLYFNMFIAVYMYTCDTSVQTLETGRGRKTTVIKKPSGIGGEISLDNILQESDEVSNVAPVP